MVTKTKKLQKLAARECVIKILVNDAELDVIARRAKKAGPGYKVATFVRLMALFAPAPLADDFARGRRRVSR